MNAFSKIENPVQKSDIIYFFMHLPAFQRTKLIKIGRKKYFLEK